MPDWQDVIKRANTDPQFRSRLKANPAAAAKEAGVDVPAGSAVNVIEQQGGELHLFLGTKTGDPKLDGLLQKAEREPAVKQQLLTNPRPQVEAALGQKLPAEATICVHERSPNSIQIVLGPDPNADHELSDQALAAVAGGGFFKNVYDRICPDKIRKVTDNVDNVITTETDRSSGGYTLTDIGIV